MKSNRLPSLLCIITLCATAAMPLRANHNSHTLRFSRPAEYFEETTVIGNGTLGAIVYGQSPRERISLNDITLWTGEPEQNTATGDPRPVIAEIRAALDKNEYAVADSLQRLLQGHYSQNYQPLGNLWIEYDHASALPDKNYARTLDISRAVGTTVNGTRTMTYFASAPDSVIIVRITDPDGLNATLSLDSRLPHKVSAQDNELAMEGYTAYTSLPGYTSYDNKFQYDESRGTRFMTIVRAITPDGKVTAADGKLKADGCRDLTLIITNVTSFNGFNRNPATDGRPYRQMARRRIDHAATLTPDALQQRAEDDYKRLFSRVTLDLGTTAPDIAALPTDEQLKSYTDNSDVNPDLEELYFQYGRYLLISCSRTPGVPANLQGLWNEAILPPWSSNYTTNINLEENYWGAETCALPEMHASLLGYLHNLAENGTHTARNHWGVDSGWCLGHNTDIWAMTCPVGLGNDSPEWANWAMGGAWLSTHIWENYLFSRDMKTLRTHYPVLRGAALFALGWLTDDNGELITSPSTSPENRFIAPDGTDWPTMKGTTADLAIIRECLADTREAAIALGMDDALVSRIDSVMPRLHPYRISPATGALQEWYYDYPDKDPQHRHQSHLIGLYPGHHLNPSTTPSLADACARTLEIKGLETTGWSAGWRINLLARLRQPEKSYAMLRRLLRYITPDKYKGPDRRRGGGTYPNMLDAHTPFQIDGNFGGSAGIAEMLVQSTPAHIILLPALPGAWKDGSVSGLRTRTGITLAEMTWKDGYPRSITLEAPASLTTPVQATVSIPAPDGPATVSVSLAPGQSRSFTF